MALSPRSIKAMDKKELIDIQKKISDFSGNMWGGDTRI